MKEAGVGSTIMDILKQEATDGQLAAIFVSSDEHTEAFYRDGHSFT